MALDIGPPVTDMTAAPDNGWQNGPDEARLICSWYSRPAAKAAAGQVLNREDYKDVGVLTAQLAIYDSPFSRGDAELMNAAFDVPEGLAPESAWLFSLKPLEMTDKLGINPPELRLGDIGVSVAYANSFATDVGTGSALTVGWSVERAARSLAAAAGQR